MTDTRKEAIDRAIAEVEKGYRCENKPGPCVGCGAYQSNKYDQFYRGVPLCNICLYSDATKNVDRF
jgi:hypothetical protein